MEPELKQRWLDALRSGGYDKGVGRLKGRDNDYCCLGVLADISNVGEWKQGEDGWEFRIDEDVAQDWAKEHASWAETMPNCTTYFGSVVGLSQYDQKALALLNDQAHSFEPVITRIEETV